MQPFYSRETQDPEGVSVTTEITGLFPAFHSPKPHEMEVAMSIWDCPEPLGTALPDRPPSPEELQAEGTGQARKATRGDLHSL